MSNKKETKYTTGNVGVQENPQARKSQRKETVNPPKVSTKHF